MKGQFNLTDLCADILLAPYGMTHDDLPPRSVTQENVPAVVEDGDYLLVNTFTEEVEEQTFLTAAEARRRNLEYESDRDDRRWVPMGEAA